MRSTASNEAPLAELSMTLPATAEHLGSVYAGMSQFWAELERRHPSPPDAAWRAYFDTAVGEIVANVVRHAYADTHDSADATVSIAIRGFADRVEATFRDRGVPYTGSIADAQLPGDGADTLDLPESGWGLAVTLAAVDDLSYTRDADINCWRLIKKL